MGATKALYRRCCPQRHPALLGGYLLWDGSVGGPPGQTISLGPGQTGVVVEAVEPEPGFRAMVLTTSGRGLKVIWVVAQGET